MQDKNEKTKLKDCNDGDDFTCENCGAGVRVTEFVDLSVRRCYECEQCGHETSEHCDLCNCKECEFDRAEPSRESRDQLIEELERRGWEVRCAMSTTTLYAYGTSRGDSVISVRISDHESSVFRKEEFGGSDFYIEVGNDWMQALDDLPELLPSKEED